MKFEGERARFFAARNARNDDAEDNDEDEGDKTAEDDFKSSRGEKFGRSGLGAGDGSGGDLIKILLFVHLFYYSTYLVIYYKYERREGGD